MFKPKEQQARLKINKLLEEAGWRLLDSEKGKANVSLEANVKISNQKISSWGKNFETTRNGYIDFLLNDQNGFPLVVLEAKRENKNPLDGKEQARKYADDAGARFVILSNGNLHYFWNLQTGDPEIIIKFPTQESLEYRKKFNPNPKLLFNEFVDENYIAETQLANFQKDPEYLNKDTREKYLEENELKILRPYQLKAVHVLQKAVQAGKHRFLFEMATGTGKTLVAAAIIKLFLRTENAKRILFLVDRIALENQAHKNFQKYLQNDFDSIIYKENYDNWKNAKIVVSTVQSLIFDSKYKQIFSPTDFDLVIADESHRAIGGNSRALFEYFVGYKLGLTATPKNYLKNIDRNQLAKKDPRAWEQRQLLDTYATFGCKDEVATFQYNLTKAVKENYLINAITVDMRTKITTELLSEKGYGVMIPDQDGNKSEQTFFYKDFERKFFSKKTNQSLIEIFIKTALKDPISKELGKSIIFCINQEHALKITQILNQIASKEWPNKYNSDFAVQITSNTDQPQQNTINFANNNLKGYSLFKENYKTSRTRVVVTVNMMTTGYDCPDVLNIGMMRPIFSPVSFIQIKGRGTRKYPFKYEDEAKKKFSRDKKKFKIFDFFGNCEYFEKKFIYDEILKLPSKSMGKINEQNNKIDIDKFEIFISDPVKTLTETIIGPDGMKIDRKFFDKTTKQIIQDDELKKFYQSQEWDESFKILNDRHVNRPPLYLTLEKIRHHEKLDRQITWKEVITRIFGATTKFKSKNDLAEEEGENFILIHKPENNLVMPIKNFIKIYITDLKFRQIIDQKKFAKLNTYSGFDLEELKKLNNNLRKKIIEHIHDYVNLSLYRE